MKKYKKCQSFPFKMSSCVCHCSVMYCGYRYQRLQQKYKDSFIYLRCPLCIEIVTGMKYLEWLNSTLDAGNSLSLSQSLIPGQIYFYYTQNRVFVVLTICHIPSFGDDPLPPIYLDIGEHKPKWELVKGSWHWKPSNFTSKGERTHQNNEIYYHLESLKAQVHQLIWTEVKVVKFGNLLSSNGE
jgi:hypothetical protein